MNKVCVIAGAKSRLFPTWAGQVPPEVRRQWGGGGGAGFVDYFLSWIHLHSSVSGEALLR